MINNTSKSINFNNNSEGNKIMNKIIPNDFINNSKKPEQLLVNSENNKKNDMKFIHRIKHKSLSLENNKLCKN